MTVSPRARILVLVCWPFSSSGNYLLPPQIPPAVSIGYRLLLSLAETAVPGCCARLSSCCRRWVTGWIPGVLGSGCAGAGAPPAETLPLPGSHSAPQSCPYGLCSQAWPPLLPTWPCTATTCTQRDGFGFILQRVRCLAEHQLLEHRCVCAPGEHVLFSQAC